MKSWLTGLFFLPLSIFAFDERFEFGHQCVAQKGQVKNTIHVHGIKFFDVDFDKSIFLDGNVEGVYGNNFSTSLGAGLREEFTNFGIGANAYWDFMNENKFAIHQIGLGLEVIFDKFVIFYNRNTPLTKDQEKKLYKVSFATSSQIGLKHFIRDDLSYSISGNVCCFNRRIGLKAEVTKTFRNNLQIGCSAMYNGEREPSFSVNVSYLFGDLIGSQKSRPTRDRRVCYQIDYAKLKPVEDKIVLVPPGEKEDSKQKGFLYWLIGDNPYMRKMAEDANKYSK